MQGCAWNVVGASVTGTSHLNLGRECEDAHVYRVRGRELLLIAVADGAGSASHAASGATTAAQSAIDAAERTLYRQPEPTAHEQWQSILRDILATARQALVRLAESSATEALPLPVAARPAPGRAVSLRDFATTLLIAIVTPNWIATAQIGDGAIVIQRRNGALKSLTPAWHGEYINETNFLTDQDALSLAEYAIKPRAGARGIALLTDGVQWLSMSYPANTPYAPFFETLFSYAGTAEATSAELAQFLASERICEHTDDDKTLVLAVCQ